jgi:hypothetical protein
VHAGDVSQFRDTRTVTTRFIISRVQIEAQLVTILLGNLELGKNFSPSKISYWHCKEIVA